MISHTASFPSFTVTLGQEAHQIAERLCHPHADWHKAEQVYLNSLAIYAVDYYLSCMGYNTDWENSDSYDPIAQTLLDVADLIVQGYGRLECRPVQSGAKAVYVPEETWRDRLGYVVVSLNDALDAAEILGFFQQINSPEMPLNQLNSLDNLSDYLADYLAARQRTPGIAMAPVDLGQWLQNVFTASWHSVEELIAAGHTELALQFRGVKQKPTDTLLVASVTRTKLIELGNPDPSILVLITLKAEQPDGAIHIQLEVLPAKNQPFLPVGLQISLLNRQGEAVMQTQTQETQDGVRLEFTSDPNEQFSIKISLNSVVIVEEFLV